MTRNTPTGRDVLHVARRAPLRLRTYWCVSFSSERRGPLRDGGGASSGEMVLIKQATYDSRNRPWFTSYSYCWHFNMKHHLHNHFDVLVLGVVIWHRGFIAPWQKASADCEHMVLILQTRAERCLALSWTPQTLCAMRFLGKRARAIDAWRWRAGAQAAHGQPHGSGAGVPETVCLPDCKHNDVPSDRANTKCPYKAHFVSVCKDRAPPGTTRMGHLTNQRGVCDWPVGIKPSRGSLSHLSEMG